MVDFGVSLQRWEKGPVIPESLARDQERYFGTRIQATRYIGVSVCLSIGVSMCPIGCQSVF